MQPPLPPSHATEASLAVLERFADPLLIIDQAGGLVLANARAEEELIGGEVFRLRGGRLFGTTDGAEAALRRCATLNGTGFDSLIESLAGEVVLFAAVPLASAGDPASRFTLVMLRWPGKEARNAVAAATRLYGLTAAQRQVLCLLVQGLTPREIGRRLGVSLTTVRTHLSDLFGKTATSRQAELVARTLTLGSPLRDVAHS
jgi:DNA-binding CsgD family transcriptional regulator